MKENLIKVSQKHLPLNKKTKVIYGINKTWSTILSKRIEWPYIYKLSTNSLNLILFDTLIFLYFYKLRHFKLLTALNILILDFIWTYRGWRHIKGLPVRGQRTWSNAWSSMRVNQILRTIRLKWALKYYNNVTKREAKIGLYAEYNNLLWKRQWRTSWFYAKTKRLKILNSKKIYSSDVYKIDLKSIASGFIFLPSLKRELTKKQKALQEKSIYAVGYEIGFSKDFYKSLLKRKLIKTQLREKKHTPFNKNKTMI